MAKLAKFIMPLLPLQSVVSIQKRGKKREIYMWVAVRGTNSSKAWLTRAGHAYIRARAAYARSLPRSCAHKRPRSTQTLRVHELLAARALTQWRPGSCTHARSPLSVHARIRLLIGACRGRLGATNFGAPLLRAARMHPTTWTARPNSRTHRFPP